MKHTDNRIEQIASKVKYIYFADETSRDNKTAFETFGCQLPKLKVAGSNPVSRSKKIKDLAITG